MSTAPALAPLPESLTTFIGRAREVAAISEVLASSRLVTLTGAGGSGKTRLAAEVARGAASRFGDGVGWIELASISEPALIAGHIAATLGLGGAGRSHTDTLRDALRQSEFLLAIDNCEHVIDTCAALVDLLLRECPRVRVLATSREALGVPGERAWLVPVLSLPEAESSQRVITESEAVRLFVDRARAASTTFALTEANATTIARLCRRLNGLPLAIELAAARVRALTPEEIVSRLNEGFRVLGAEPSGIPRHRTLREAIGWSYDLLDDRERVVLQRLSVFAGELTLEAAETVCAGGNVAADAVLDLLAALVDKSLVVVREQVDEARYRLLETVRQFARDHLEESTEASAVRRRHAAYYASLIRDAEPHFITPARPIWVDRVQRELDDVRLVLAWSRENDTQLHVELAGRLGWFWYSAGLWTEGRRWLEDALALAADRSPRRARILFGAGVIASLQGQGETAREWLDESATIARETGDGSLAAYSDSYMGVALGQEGLPAAEAPTRAALAWFTQSGDLYGQRLALVVLATLLIRQGDLDGARATAEEGVRVARIYGLGRELGIALQILGTAQLHGRQLDAAARTIGEALRALRRDPQAFWIARAMELMGVVECARARPLHAARLFGAAEARRERMGALMFRLDRDRLAPHIATARVSAGEDAFSEAWQSGRAMLFDAAIDVAIANAMVEPGSRVAPARVEASRTGANPIALRVNALGPLEIIRDGVSVDDTVWKSSRLRELLMHLLVHEPGRTREEIGIAFWPEASPAQVKNNFHVMLHHLRRTLGRSDLIVFEGDRYRVNRALGVEIDVETFERDVVAARRALRSRAHNAEVLANLRAALAGYRAPFLANENAGDWHLELRDHLHRIWTDGSTTLGARLMDTEQYDEAVEVYRRLVGADELNEDAHRQLMAALARSGHRGEAMRLYDRFAALLRKDLEASPERETTLLYDRLRRAEPV